MTGMALAVLAAVLSGVAVVFTKAGMRQADVYLVNAVSNTIIWLMFVLTAVLGGKLSQLSRIENWFLLTASGVFLGGSWVFYYLGLKDGPAGAVLALQNLSIPLTMLLAWFCLNEVVTGLMWAGAALIGTGTVLMAGEEEGRTTDHDRKRFAGFFCGNRWIWYEIFSAACMSLSLILTKLDDSPVDTNVSSAARYLIVVVIMWGLYGAAGSRKRLPWPLRDRMKILLGALFLGGGYVLFYKALAVGNVNVVTTIFRMGMIPSVILSALFLGESMPGRKKAGVVIMAVGLVLYVG